MVGCCLLTAVEALSANHCRATPQQQPTRTLPSVRDHAVAKKPIDRADSSSLPLKPIASPADYDNSLGFHLLRNIALDQRAIWTSPARVRLRDADWLVPFGGLTAGLIATDRDTSLHLSNNPATLNHYDNLSNYMIASLVGGAGGLYLWGHITHNDHQRETCLMSGEGDTNSLGVVAALK